MEFKSKKEIANIIFNKTKDKIIDEIEGNVEDVKRSETLQDLYDNLSYLTDICKQYLEELDSELSEIE